MNYRDVEFASPQSIVDSCVSFFKSIFTTSQANTDLDLPAESQIFCTLSISHITVDEIYDTLKKAENIFTLSVFPNAWKNTFICPLLKKSSPSVFEN